MPITDYRVLITANNTTANIDDLAGSPAGSQNTDTFVEGTASVSDKASIATLGLLYDFGSAQDFTNNTFYIWWNVATAGLLDTKAGGGVRMRFCGATVTDFFELILEGKDTYSGGWKMSVVSIGRARSEGQTGGTPPAVSAVRYVGMVFDHPGMISGNFQNVFIDAMWRLPPNRAGIRVEGRNGTTPYTWADVISAGDAGDTTKAWGSVFRRNGVVFLNTPVQFGTNDATYHAFDDTREVVAFENQIVATNTFYGYRFKGGSGTNSFIFGSRSGSGDESVGFNGCTFLAPASGSRFSVTATNSSIDEVSFLGCSFIHSSTIQAAHTNTELRSCVVVDGNSLLHADATDNGQFQKNTITGANTADGVAFVTTDTPSKLKNCTFVFSDGHGVEITTTGTHTFEGNVFSGYGADDTNDAAVYNNSGGALTLLITGDGSLPTVRNGSGASTSVVSAVTLTVTNIQSNSELRIYRTSDSVELAGEENTSTSFQYSYDANDAVPVFMHVHHLDYVFLKQEFTLQASDQLLPIFQRSDRVYDNP